MTAHDIDLAALGRYDTPTICNALLAVAPEAARRSTKGMLHCARPALPLRPHHALPHAGARRPRCCRGQGAGPRLVRLCLRRAGPRIVVVQDGDTPHAATNALFGEVMSFIMHSALGCIGLITNGAVRDVAGIAEGFQALYGGLAPNRADYHRVDFDCEVNVAGLYARSDTLIHADANGAVAVPPGQVPAILEAAAAITAKEQAIIDFCRDPAVTPETSKHFWAEG